MSNKKTYTAAFREAFVTDWPKYEGTFVDYCAARGVTRETGYVWLDRFRQEGLAGLQARSSAPHVCPHATPLEVQELIVAARRVKTHWGARKLRPWLASQHPDVELPVPSVMTDILRKYGLTQPRKRRKRTPRYTAPFAAITAPNDVWSIDFKGHFRTGDGLWCYPLTLTDNFSRYLFRCDAYRSTAEAGARRSCELAFREFGLPSAIRSDNGSPFASTAPGGLSTLSVWWVQLGIVPERIPPASPAQNGRHERMHRTLKAEATDPPRANLPLQQRAFNSFRREYDDERPHEALGQVPPATVYSKSTRPYPRKLPEITYPDSFELRRVDYSGHLKFRGNKFFVSEVVRTLVLGLTQTADGIWDLFFGPVRLGAFNLQRPELGLIRPPSR
jgi:transposase InsO family protein